MELDSQLRQEGAALVMELVKKLARNSRVELSRLSLDHGSDLVYRENHILTISAGGRTAVVILPDNALAGFLAADSAEKTSSKIRQAIQELSCGSPPPDTETEQDGSGEKSRPGAAG